MKKRNQFKGIIAAMLIGGTFTISCSGNKKTSEAMEMNYEKGTFGYDLNYLSEKDSLIVLKSDDEKAQVILSAKYQAKVFTSTASGPEGRSHGFVNYNFFESGVVDEHMNGFGGENRLWLGPEGGQYSIFFEPGKEQVYDNWHTPKGIDIEAWTVREATTKSATFTKKMPLQNYLGNNLLIAAERTVSLVSDSEIATSLGIIVPKNVHAVAYATENRITNQNDYEWTTETGTVCIWMLDMFIPSDSAVTVIPYRTGDENDLGRVVTSDYFGDIPADRLIDENGVLYFKRTASRGGKWHECKRVHYHCRKLLILHRSDYHHTFNTDPEAIFRIRSGIGKEIPDWRCTLAYNAEHWKTEVLWVPFLNGKQFHPQPF